MGQAFAQLFSKPDKKGAGKSADAGSILQLLSSIMCDIAGCETDGNGEIIAKPEDVASASFTASDIPVAKVQGVRAAKGLAWLQRIETPCEILAAVVCTEHVGHLSAWLLKGQSHQTWLHRDPQERPLVALATLRYSPAAKCVDALFHLLHDGKSGRLALFDGTLVVVRANF